MPATSSSAIRCWSAIMTRGSSRSRPRRPSSAPSGPRTTPTGSRGTIRDLLARFGLTGDQAFQTVGQALRRREGQGRLARLAATGGESPRHGRADQPPRHLVVRRPRTVDPRVRGDRPRRHPRPLFPQPGRRPDRRRRRRPGPRHRGGLRDLPAPRRPGGRLEGLGQGAGAARRPSPRIDTGQGRASQAGNSPIASPTTSRARDRP